MGNSLALGIMHIAILLAPLASTAIAETESEIVNNTMIPDIYDIPNAPIAPNFSDIPGLSNLTSNLTANANIILLPNMTINIIVIQNMTTTNILHPDMDSIANDLPETNGVA